MKKLSWILVTAWVTTYANCTYAATTPQTEPDTDPPGRALVHTDLSYQTITGTDPARQRIDVFTRSNFESAPMVLFIHGGAWRAGDKKAVGQKPRALLPAGFVVASANYRFRPDVEVGPMAQDVATAVAWLHANAERFGGNAERIFLMGHSAGAHLVAVVGTNEAYLKNVGLSHAIIRGVIPLDTGPYNVALQMERTSGRYGQLMTFVFGEDRSKWQAVSPWHHVSARTPPFLVFTSDGRQDAAIQARPFVERLQAHGVEASVIEAKGKDHGALNREMGQPGDPTIDKAIEFMTLRSR